MKSEWKSVELIDACSRLSSGKNIPAKYVKSEGAYPVYGGNGIRGYTDISNFEGECAIIGRQGAYCGNVRYFSGKAYMTEHAVVTCGNKISNTRFLAYLLSTMQLGHLSGQSAQPGLSVKTLGRQMIKLPPLNVQNAIVNILASLDDKIELNNKINKNLEQQAQAIFKAWFLDYEPYGGAMPKDWSSGTLGQIAEIKTNSFSPSKNPNVMLEHYSIPAYDEKRFPVFEIASDVKSNKYILNRTSVMISKLNPNTKRIWRPLCLTSNPVCSMEFIVYEPVKTGYRDFVYSVIDDPMFSVFLCAHTTGSTNSRQRVTPSVTLNYPVPIPTDEVMKDFCEIVSPMYDLISSNIYEDQKLKKTRNSLLPQLMSGIINVSGLDL